MFKKIKEFFRERKIEKNLFNSPAFLERYTNGEKMPNEEGIWLGNIKKGERNFEIVDSNKKIPIAFISGSKNLYERSRYIVPSLLKTWKKTAIIFDVSDKIEILTAGARKKLFENKILKFDPSKNNTEKYNFLSEIRILTKNEKNDVKNISDAFSESYSIFGKINSETSKEEISDFVYSAIFYNLYKSFLADPQAADEKMIYFNKSEYSKNKIVNFSKFSYVSNASMGEVYDFIKKLEDIENPNELFKEILAENIIKKYGKDENIRNIVKEWIKNSEKELKYSGLPYTKNFMDYSKMKKDKLKTIINETLKCLEIFEKESYLENTTKSSFRINEIINSDKPVTLYLKINSADIIKSGPIFKIFVKQFIEKVEENQLRILEEFPAIWQPENGKHNILLVLNEFLAFGKFENIEKFLEKAVNCRIKTFFNFSTDPEDRIYEKGFLKNNFPCRIIDCEPEIKKENSVGNKQVSFDSQESRLVFPEGEKKFPPQTLFLKNNGWNFIKMSEVLVEENEELKGLVEIF